MWYLRESYTAFLCANLPLTYPLVQRVFKLRSWSQNSYHGRYATGTTQPPRTWLTGLRSLRKSHIGSTNSLVHGGISKTVSIKVSNGGSGSGGLQRSDSEERIHGPPTSAFEQKSLVEPESEQPLWVPPGSGSATFEMVPISPTSAKASSVTTSGSLKSLENAHIRN